MYKKKLLFRNSNGTYLKEATSIESCWAYLHGIELKTTGRFRIRITKMTGAELVMMGLAPTEIPEDFYGLQANLDKWQQDLCNQFEAFVTGIGVEEEFGLEIAKPVKSSTFKMPVRKKVVKLEVEPVTPAPVALPEPDSEDDDDWI